MRINYYFLVFFALQAELTFSKAADKPYLSVTPRAAELAQPDLAFTVTITNSTFLANATVSWNGSPRPTAPGSDNTHLVVTLLASDIAQIPNKTPTFSVTDASGVIRTVGLPIYPRCGAVENTATNASGVAIMANSNGRYTTTGVSCGDETTAWHNAIQSSYGSPYQCVEFVRRYYDSLVPAQYTTKSAIWRGNAVTFFDTYARRGMVQFSNGSSTPPLPDDLVVFRGPDWLDKKGKTHLDTVGHVAIVTGVTATTVSLIEQNWSSAGGAQLPYDHTTHTIGTNGKRGTYTVLGWLRSATPVKLPTPPSAAFTLSYPGQSVVFSTNGMTIGAGNTLGVTVSPGQAAIINFNGSGSTGTGTLTYRWTSDGSVFPPSVPCTGSTCQFGLGAAGSPHTIALVVKDSYGQTSTPAIAAVAVTESVPTGSVVAQATLDGTSWSGSVVYGIICSSQTLNKIAVPLPATTAPAGNCTLSYTSGGPSNSTLTSIAPCGILPLGPTPCTGTLGSGQTLTFTLGFQSNPPTAGFSMSSGSQSATDGQTLTLTVTTGTSASVNFDASQRSTAYNANTITGRQWTLDGSVVATTATFSQSVVIGTHTVSLVVTDSRNVQSAAAQGTVVVAPGYPATGNGWRMSGYNGSRVNNSLVIGPFALPTFVGLITTAQGTLQRIAKDGSLLLYDGSSVNMYSNLGTLKWTTSVGGVSDIAISPTGTVYTSTPASLTAWNKDTGLPEWPSPVAVNNGNETSALAIDSAGTVYMMTGASYVGPANKLSAIKPDSTFKWEIGGNFRGYSQVVLSTDETVAYFLDLNGYTSLERGVSTVDGHDLYGSSFYPRSNTYAFAPWGTLYLVGSDGFVDFLLGCTATLSCNSVVGGDYGVVSLLPAGIIVASRSSDGKVIGMSRTGTTLWVANDPLGAVISDANGTIYATVAGANAVAAINGATGSELWRQTFTSTPAAMLLGDDGCLYVSVGTSLQKVCR